MMQYVILFFSMALVALAVENAVFARGLGLHRAALLVDSPGMALLFGASLTWVSTLSSIPVGFIIRALEGVERARLIRTPLFLLCVIAVYIATYYAAKHLLPSVFNTIRLVLPVCSFNTALFGALYVSTAQSFTVLQTVGYAFGSGVGCTIAMLVIYYARKRLVLCPVPRSFRGMPVLLVYLGLLSLALYGLLGHGLPT